MPRRANTQTQQEAVQENAAVQADAGADMQMEAAITKTQPEKGVLALADVKIGDFMTIRNVRIWTRNRRRQRSWNRKKAA